MIRESVWMSDENVVVQQAVCVCDWESMFHQSAAATEVDRSTGVQRCYHHAAGISLLYCFIRAIVSGWYSDQNCLFQCFLARDLFVEWIVGLLSWYSFVRPSVCLSVRPFVHLSGTGVHCAHRVHFSADLSLRLDSPMFWALWHPTYSQPSFSSSTWKRGTCSLCRCKLNLHVNTNIDK